MHTKLVREARMVAERAHGHQSYGGIFPYTKHLDDVVTILEQLPFSEHHLAAGYLHDAMEDGNISYNDIKSYFGFEVAELVYSVTDELGRNRAERKKKTLAKLALYPEAICVKLADRIANISHGGKIEMYKKEHSFFVDQLFSVSPARDLVLWQKLDELLGLKP